MKTLVVLIVVVAAASCTSASRLAKAGLIIGTDFYFTDTEGTTKPRAQSLEFCKSQGAGLARVVNQMDFLMLRSSIPRGTYWIDGIDDPKPTRMVFDDSCSPATGVTWSITNILTPSTSCMAMVNGNTATESGVFSSPCETAFLTLCSFPTTGCTPPPEP